MRRITAFLVATAGLAGCTPRPPAAPPARTVGASPEAASAAASEAAVVPEWSRAFAADGGPVVFALNVEAARAGFEVVPARLRIATAILESEGILPPATP